MVTQMCFSIFLLRRSKWTFARNYCKMRKILRIFCGNYKELADCPHTVKSGAISFTMSNSIWTLWYSEPNPSVYIEVTKLKIEMWIRSIERAYKLNCLFHSLPWNQDTILGYAGEMLVGLLYILVFWMIDFQILILFIAICYHQFTFYEMFVNFVVHLKQSKKTYRKTNAILKIVKFHKDIKR